jgi:hypothetical protein
VGAGRLHPAYGWVLVILLSVFAFAPLTYPGFFQVQSGFLPAFNVEQISDAPNWGRVPDLLRGEGKLPYLLAWPFLQASGSGVAAIKWGYGLAFLLAALAAYGWTRHWLGTRGGLLAAIVYTYLPWHLATVYTRGAYAEAWLWVYLPLVLWAIDRLAQRRFLAAGLVGLAASVAALWTQPGLFALALPLLAAYAATLLPRSRRPLGWILGALAASLLVLRLVAWIAPATTPSSTFQFLYPFQLFSAAWGDGLSFQLGLAGVGLSLVAVALWLNNRSQGSPQNDTSHPPVSRALWFWAVTLLLILLLMLPVSTFLWRWTGWDAFVHQPWQLLIFTGPPLAFLAGSVVRQDRRLAALPAWAGLIAFAILAAYPYLAPPTTLVDPGPEPLAMFQAGGQETPEILLLDYEIAPPTEITPTLTLTMTWQAVQPPEADYTVFVHTLAADDTKAAQRDTYPCDGECPTTSWQPGQIVVDRHQFDLPPDAPLGPYRLATGLYLLGTGQRLAIPGRDDGMVVLDVP